METASWTVRVKMECLSVHNKLLAALERRLHRNRLLAISVLVSALPAHAIPPPPERPPLLREAKMTAAVQLIEARDGSVTKITELCKVRGKIPVYSDSGFAASVHAREITGCKMSWNGKNLSVSVRGAKAISTNRDTYAHASVSVLTPDAVPLCSMCGPQPLADSAAEIRTSSLPKRVEFSLKPNLVSMLNAKPTLWLEADIEIVD